MAAVRPAGPDPMMRTRRRSSRGLMPRFPLFSQQLYDAPAPPRDAAPQSTNGPGDRSPGPPGRPVSLLLGDVGRLLALGALHDVELHRLALGQRAEARALDGRVVDEDVLPAGALDQTVPLGLLEPLDHTALAHSFGLLPFKARGWRPTKNRKGHFENPYGGIELDRLASSLSRQSAGILPGV